jgi:DNA-binding NarL/FixJ family response regulator
MTVFLVEDDLFFSARVKALARRLGLDLRVLAPGEVEQATLGPGSVVIVQVTLHSDRQLALIERLRARRPPPTVVAVAGHLETALRRRARALGALVASHSSMERTIARAGGRVSHR